MSQSLSHAGIRAAERHRLSVTSADLWEASQDIVLARAGESLAAQFVNNRSNGCQTWRVVLAGKAVTVVYDPTTTRICTVLPEGK